MSILVQQRHIAALVALVLVLVVAAFIREPVFEGSLEREMSPDLPELIAARGIREALGERETSAIILSPAEGASIGDVFAALDRMHVALARIENVSVRSITDTRGHLFFYGMSESDPIEELLSRIRTAPDYRFLVSQSGHMFADLVGTGIADEDQIYSVVDSLPDDGVFDDRRVLAGERLNEDVAEILRDDLRVLIPTILLTSLFVLYVAFGHWRALLLPAFASVASTVIVLATLSVAGITINLVTLLALPVVLIVSIANSCHFLAKSAAVGTAEMNDAITRTLRRVALPYFLSSLTTAIALASLALGEIDPIADLGVVASVALLVSFALNVLAAPFAIGLYLSQPATTMASTGLYRRITRGLARHRRSAAVALLIVGITSFASIPRLTFHSDPRNLFPDNTEFTETFRLFESNFYNFAPLHVLIAPRSAAQDEAALRQAFAEADDLRTAIAGYPGVRGINISSAEGRPGALMLTAMIETAEEIGTVAEYLRGHAANAPQALDVSYSSPSIVYTSIDRRALDSLLRSLGWSVLLILATLAFVFRSGRAIAAAVIANAVPLALVLGAAWALDAPFNLVTAFVFLVVLGIVVDDTIHILHRARSGDGISGSSIEFSVIWSTILLCVGLMLCQMSDFPTTRDFGVYCSIALVGAVVSDLTILPLVLKASKRDAGTRHASDSDIEVGDG